MSKYSISDIPLTMSEKMNREHKEFINILNTLYDMVCESSNNDKQIDTELNHIYEHNTQHFRDEEELMQKSAFPPYKIHKGEHDRVLKILNDSIIHWQLNRDQEIIKDLVGSVLPDWFFQHVATMDKVTAQFFEQSKNQQAV